MSEYKDFSSLPPDTESQFVVFEKRTVESGKKAMKIGMIVAAAFGLLTIIIVFSFPEPKNKMAGDDMGMLKRADPKEAKSGSEPAPAEPAPAAADSADTPSSDTAGSDEAAGDSAAADEGDSESDE